MPIPASRTTEPRTLLDELVPSYDAAARHSLWVAAAPAQVYQVARAADLGAPGLVRLLLGLRAAPALVAAALGRAKQAPARDDGCRVGGVPFVQVVEAPGVEFVLGLLGRFWTPSGGLVPSTAGSYRAPPPPGLAQALWNFHVAPRGGGTELSTETRIRCGDAATRRQFLRYWRIVRFGSGLTRRSMLRSIRRSAEAGVGTV